MPPKNTHLVFNNHQKKLPIPFVAYGDFECFTKPTDTSNPSPHESNTSEYQKHEPSGICLYLKPLDGINKYFSPIVYAKQTENADISDVFVKKLKSLTKVFK